MSFEHALDFISLVFTFLIIYIIITLIWYSTFVTEPIIPTATMVVIQEQSLAVTTERQTTSEASNSEPPQQKEEESNLSKKEVIDQSTENEPSTSSNSLAVNQPDEIDSTMVLDSSSSSEKSEVIGTEEADVQTDSEDQNMNSENADIIKIRLKFLDDTLKQVYGDLQENVGSFKRKNFQVQMNSNSIVKLIFNGQMLSEDTSTLAFYGLFDNCVVHCFVSDRTERQQEQVTVLDPYSVDMSEVFGYVVGGGLAFMWYLFVYHHQIFNFSSTLSLLFITGMALVAYNPISRFVHYTEEMISNFITDSIVNLMGRIFVPPQQQEVRTVRRDN